MSKSTKPRELVSPFNYEKPDSRCPKHLSRAGRPLSHKFKTTERKLVRSGVFAVRMTCEYCGNFTSGTEDYTVLANIFSIPESTP